MAIPGAVGVLDLTVLDAPDPRALADFYCALLGWTVQSDDGRWVQIRGPQGGLGLAFQRADDYVPTTWPDQAVPQQMHLDIDVADLDEAEAGAIALGAVPTGEPERPAKFRAYRDPAGHVFCLCRSQPGGLDCD